MVKDKFTSLLKQVLVTEFGVWGGGVGDFGGGDFRGGQRVYLVIYVTSSVSFAASPVGAAVRKGGQSST
jgi:hypothetical protein